MDTWIFWTVIVLGFFCKDPAKYMMASHMHSLKDPLYRTLDHHNPKCKRMTVLHHRCSYLLPSSSKHSLSTFWQMWRNRHQRSKKVSGTHACFSSKVNFVIDYRLSKDFSLWVSTEQKQLFCECRLTFLWGHLKLELFMGFLSFYIWKI